jgi:hypothetical protein
VAEREASRDFDNLWDDPTDTAGLTSDDQDFEAQPPAELDDRLNDPGDDLWDDPDDNFWDNQPAVDDHDRFDAFNDNTWSFKPAPTPWYRTKQAMTAIIAACAAVAAIVVSGVLLVFRSPGDMVNQMTSSVTPTAPTSVAPIQVASSEVTEPPLAPPPPPRQPPPSTVASPVNPAPRYEPTYEPRPTKAPEIGVTRTPVTRQPISVAPQPRSGANQRH